MSDLGTSGVREHGVAATALAFARARLAGRFGRAGAAAALALIAALVLLGVLGGAVRYAPGAGPPANDHVLYERVIAEVASGAPYDQAAVRDQRQAGYPVRPFITVRLPTLAVALAALPDVAARRAAAEILAVAVVVAWIWRWRSFAARPVGFSLAVLLLAGSALPAFAPYGYSLHELWAGDLIALSLVCHRQDRWGASLALGLLAVAVRELAAPYLLAMAAMALVERRRAEGAAWVAALAAFAIGLALHAGAVRALVGPADASSPGWLVLGGWPFLLSAVTWNGALLLAPGWLVALVAPFALAGCLSAPGPLGRRLALVVTGYAFAFLIAGRPDNAYWGLMIAPLWPLGLIFVGPALRTLAAAARPMPEPIARADSTCDERP